MKAESSVKGFSRGGRKKKRNIQSLAGASYTLFVKGTTYASVCECVARSVSNIHALSFAIMANFVYMIKMAQINTARRWKMTFSVMQKIIHSSYI